MNKPVVGERRVPVVETPIVETNSIDELSANLSMLLESNIPAFVLRNAALSDRNIQTNGDLRSLVAGLLLQGGLRFTTAFVMPDIAQTLRRREVGQGELHQDAADTSVGKVTQIDVHTTTAGAGNVLVANSGPFFETQQNERPDPTYSAIKTELNSMLAEGYTDPTFMSPEVQVTSLGFGDHIVFAAYNAKGPVWHRFDTTEAPRIACVSELTAA